MWNRKVRSARRAARERSKDWIGDAVVEGFPREAMRAAAAYVLLFAHLIQVSPPMYIHLS